MVDWPWMVIAVILCLVVGFIAGLFCGQDVRAEFSMIRLFLRPALCDLHRKLDAILKAVVSK